MSDRTNELYILTQKAQNMERINEEVALKIYLDIFADFTPKISKTYESTIRLLEKRQRNKEALEICQQAIELIKADEISGVLSKFEAIESRLTSKLNVSGELPQSNPRKISKQAVVIISIVVVFSLLLIFLNTPDRELDVNLEGKDSLEGGLPFVTPRDPEDVTIEYPITEAMIEVARESIRPFIDVTDSDIIPQNETLGFAIIVSPGTSEERAKEIATLLVRNLSGAASASYSDLRGPQDNHLGEIYDYYEIIISVGTSTAPEDLIARGTKNKGATQIYWRRNNP